jgi:MOSC domain-containing protein YiiM
VTGLRNPCGQLDGIQPGLRSATIDRAGDEVVRRKAGIMGIVVAGGDVRAGDAIGVELPALPHRPLDVV